MFTTFQTNFDDAPELQETGYLTKINIFTKFRNDFLDAPELQDTGILMKIVIFLTESLSWSHMANFCSNTFAKAFHERKAFHKIKSLLSTFFLTSDRRIALISLLKNTLCMKVPAHKKMTSTGLEVCLSFSCQQTTKPL